MTPTDKASKLKHPKSVKIGPVVFEITSDRDRWLKIEHETQTKNYYGHTDPMAAKIFLNPDCPETVTRLTLWHEVLHAITATLMGTPDWRHLGKEPKQRDESVVSLLEAPTLMVMVDNPELLVYLTTAD